MEQVQVTLHLSGKGNRMDAIIDIFGQMAVYLAIGFVGFLFGATITCIIILKNRKKKQEREASESLSKDNNLSEDNEKDKKEEDTLC